VLHFELYFTKIVKDVLSCLDSYRTPIEEKISGDSPHRLDVGTYDGFITCVDLHGFKVLA
jgi:hypothetical protein